jgi:type VI secretion system protein ImpG
LAVSGVQGVRNATLLKKPTPTRHFERTGVSLWHLVSHLSLNHLSLSGRGLDTLKEILRLYNLPKSATNGQQIDALASIEFLPAQVWMQGQPCASFVRGTQINLSVREENFVGTGLRLFISVLDRFFGLYVHTNSFTRLHVLCVHSQKLLIECQPRRGLRALV